MQKITVASLTKRRRNQMKKSIVGAIWSEAVLSRADQSRVESRAVESRGE